jgi:hypothetical protein
LGKLRDIADYVDTVDAGSDSEAEDAPEAKISLPQDFAGDDALLHHLLAIIAHYPICYVCMCY